MKRDSTWPARRFDKCAGAASSYGRSAAGVAGGVEGLGWLRWQTQM